MATRREKVVLELEDDLSPGLLRAAAAAKVLDKELNSLSGRAVQTSRSSANVSRDLDGVSKSSRNADRSINQLTGRLRLFADAAAIFGPATVPVGGVLAAGVAGFASQLGFAAIAGGVLVGSMQGLGDALTALNDAHLEPTAENLTKAEDALNALSPAAATFAQEAYGLLPILRGIRDAGAEGLFPGLTESLDDLERLAPTVARIFESVGSALGEIAADSAASLASERWAGFFDFIAAEAPQALSEMASAIGDVTHGLAELWMAFGPLNQDMSGWLMDVAAGFDSWASGLSQTDGFRDFVDYIRTTGPQVADTFGALANAVVQIVQAAAPLGGPVLQAIESFADAIAAIADSNIGTLLLSAAAGMAAFSRASKGVQAVAGTKMFAPLTADLKQMVGALDSTTRSSQRASMSVGAFAAADRQRLATLGKSTAAIAGLTLATSGAADGMGLTNTATLALMGTLAGPWGSAAGASVGLLMDMAGAARTFGDEMGRVDEALASGNLTAVNAAIEETSKKLKDATTTSGVGDFFADFYGAGTLQPVKEREEALRRLRAEQESLLAAEQDAASDRSFYNMLQAESGALEKNIGLMQAKRDAALKGFSAETSYASALLDAKKAIEENGRAWNLNTEAGVKNRRALEQQAGAWNELNRSTDQSPAAFRRARNALIETAEQMGASKAEARKYANELLDIPSDLKTKISLDVDTATQRARAIKAELASIDRNIDIYVNVRRPNAGGFGPQVGGSADGGTVPKTGKPYADRHLYLLADGEEVVSNRSGQADRWRPLLKAINGGLAEGGTAGKRRATGGMVVIDNTAALEQAIERLSGRLDAQTDATEEAAARTQEWADKMSEVGKATTSGFNTGLFERGGAWSSGGGWLSNLTKDIRGLEQRGALQSQLAGAGLSGDALAALLAEGSNSDLSALLASGGVSQFAALFNQRAALQGSVGAAGGQLAYGAQFAYAQQRESAYAAEQAKTTAAIGVLTGQVARLETSLAAAAATAGREFGSSIRSEASAGHRSKKARGK